MDTQLEQTRKNVFFFLRSLHLKLLYNQVKYTEVSLKCRSNTLV